MANSLHLISDASSDVGVFDAEKGKGLTPIVSTVQAVEQNDQWTASSVSEEHLELIYAHLEDKSFEEWLQILQDAIEYHRDDPLLFNQKFEFLEELSLGPLPGQNEEEWHGLVAFEAFVIHEWSIYPEVRSVTLPIDEVDDEDYVNVRVYVIAIVWSLCGAVIGTFFAQRSVSLSLSNLALQTLVAGSGYLWALLPRIVIPVGFGNFITLNSGRSWSFKEQMLASLGVIVSNGAPYAIAVIISQGNKYFYGHAGALTYGYQIILILSSTVMGYGFGGLYRSMLVYPSRMGWFNCLGDVMASRTFTQKDIRENIHGWKLKRSEFLAILMLISFCWYWVVNNVLTFLQYFTWICYIAPDNVNVNAITGRWTGLSLNPIDTLDFNQIIWSAIYVPVYSYANQLVGWLIGFIVIVIIWYKNANNTGYFPILSPLLYDNTAKPYNVSRITDSLSQMTDPEKLRNYSLPYWSAGYVVAYGGEFASYTMVFVYGFLNNWIAIKHGLKGMCLGLRFWKTTGRAVDRHTDSFCRRQARYREVPEWVYLLVMVIAFGMAVGCVEGYKFTDTPVWTIVLGIVLAFILMPAMGILYAQSANQLATNVIFELIIGYACEGRSDTLLVSKCYATNFFVQTDNWISNQKIAHYSGIKPWAFFSLQMLTTLLTCFAQAGIITFQLDGGIPDMCNPKNLQLMTCSGTRTYFNASVVWGGIGPRLMFKYVYPGMKWCFLVGAIIPFPFYFWRKMGPKIAEYKQWSTKSWSGYIVSGKFLKYVNEVLLLLGAFSSSPLTCTTYYVNFVFQLYIRPKFPRWWTKYAYLLPIAISIGSGWAGFFNFWATQYSSYAAPKIWTNTVRTTTMDQQYTAVRKTLKPGEHFGLGPGEFQ